MKTEYWHLMMSVLVGYYRLRSYALLKVRDGSHLTAAVLDGLILRWYEGRNNQDSLKHLSKRIVSRNIGIIMYCRASLDILCAIRQSNGTAKCGRLVFVMLFENNSWFETSRVRFLRRVSAILYFSAVFMSIGWNITYSVVVWTKQYTYSSCPKLWLLIICFFFFVKSLDEKELFQEDLGRLTDM